MFIIGNTNENSEEEKRDQDANHIASNEERECNQNISIKGEMCELKNFEEKGGLYTTRDREHDDKSPRNFPTNTSLNNINQNTSKPILLYDFPGFGLVYTSN
ncbi:hypothetical protein EDEG_00024 [Edhazardia aedis USNM 41457]|uniref:Uncharacterized protein n=1 Tax=Edhazardia aedis (strain USNM 41457) TaxID=1003232 RepID=J9DFP9_EDHAE|nr:hypothetical protein EDEG_00024 [Edhazardia aedis USNM 41457]|eukprot:EJW01430.1 hypothetical protein EDEG_00024 [Edhazardia aedis USNM 41457]